MKRAWLAVLIAGCASARPPAPPPREALPVIAVVPVAQPEFAPLLVSELSKTGRWRATMVEDGRKPKADAVLSVTIHEFDPYDPPRLALSVRLQRGPGTGAGDLDRLSQSGTWSRGPRSPDAPGFDLVLDSRDRSTREALWEFIRTQDGTASAFTGEREYLAVSTSYLRFAAHQVASRVAHER